MSSRSFATTTGRLAKPCALNSAASKDRIELILIGAVIRDGCGGILELMSGQHADDTIRRSDDAFFAQTFRSRDAGGTRGFAAEAAGADASLRVHDFLVAHIAHDPLANIKNRSETFF